MIVAKPISEIYTIRPAVRWAAPWLRTNGVNTNGAAAKTMKFAKTNIG